MRTPAKTIGLLLFGTVFLLTLTSMSTDLFGGRTTKVDRAVIRPDASVKSRLGRDVCNVLFSPRSVVLYSLNPLERPSKDDRTIAGYKVNKKECTVAPDYFSVLQSLLADSASYNDSPLIPAVAFTPNVAIEVATKADTVCAIFSFASEQMGIVVDGELVKTVRYANTRQFLLYFYRILNNDLYHKQLNTKK